jgi:ribosomal protein S6
MNQYELMFIINPSLADKERDELIKSVKSEITSRSGKIEKEDIW